MSRLVLACAGAAALLAASAVIGQRVGLALTVVVLLVVTAAWAARRPRGIDRLALVLAAALAVVPVLRDAGWVVAVGVVAALVATGAAVVRPATWTQVAHAAAAPLDWPGTVQLTVGLVSTLPRPGHQAATRALRGTGIAAGLLVLFGALFVTADSAFADLTGDLLSVPADPGDVAARVGAAILVIAVSLALAWSGRPRALGPGRRPWTLGRVELTIALSALVLLFALFVAVQLRVLFGGAGYVQRTTGLGYGDYARQGFAQLLVIAALTLSVVAIAARRREARVRLLLGALCGLTLIVLLSAAWRLHLVIDSYGLTRVRYAGIAVLVWLGLMVLLVLGAGAWRRFVALAPRIAVAATLLLVLGFALSDPDARIAEAAVDRYEQRGEIDRGYLSSLSADAIGPLRRLPAAQRDAVLEPLCRRLAPADGVAGFNLARARAR